MSRSENPTGSFAALDLPVEQARLLDRTCDEFEAAWRAGRRPDIDSAVAGLPTAVRPVAVRELVQLDVFYRRQAGEGPAAGEYSSRFPELDPAWLAAAVSTPAGRPGDRASGGTGAVPAPAADGSGTVIGPYKLLEAIGAGGMGEVWVAEQAHPVRRLVALKLVRPGMDSRQVVARFGAERQALALMDHPNIAKVLDAGTAPDGRPFFVMELVRGVPITRFCDEHKLTPRQRLELFIPVCQAVQHAHQKGVIHRDLKPSNVLVALYDDRPVPKVIDFGVAKATGQQLTEQTLHTSFGAVIGTPEYMSPEQAGFEHLDIDTRTDVYSLGVLMYELLTGSTPVDRTRFKEVAVLEVLRVVREEEPPKPSTKLSTATGLARVAATRGTDPARLARLVRGELDWIVMKCLEKDRTRRYQTANGLAMDVQRYLADEPVEAGPPSAWYRLRKLAGRQRAALGATAAVALALLAGTAVSVWQAVRATRAEGLAADRLTAEVRARQEADLAREAAETARRREAAEHAEAERLAEANRAQAEAGRRQVYAARVNLAHQAFEAGDVRHALNLLLSVSPQPGDDDLRGFEWYYMWRLCHGDRLTLRGFPEAVFAVAYSPDGRTLAAGGKDGVVKVWNAETGEPVTELPGLGAQVRAVAFSPDGRRLAAGGGTPDKPGAVRVWETGAWAEVRRLDGFRHPVLAVAFAPDGATLATGAARLTDQGVTPLLRLFYVASGPQTGEVQLWDLDSGRSKAALPGITGGILSIAFAPDGKALAAGGWDTLIRVWEIGAERAPTVLRGHTSYVWSVAYDRDGKTLATASGKWDGRPEVRLWDLPAGRERALLRGHGAGVTAVAFAPDGKSLATASWDKTVRLWDSAAGEERAVLRGHTGYVSAVAFGPGGDRLLTGGYDGTARQWYTRLALDRTALEGGLQHGYHLSFSPDGRQLAAAGAQSVAVFDLAGGGPPVTLSGQPNQTVVAFAPDGRSLAVAGMRSPGGTVRVYDPATWRVRSLPKGHDDTIWTLAFSPDGKTLATGGRDNTVRLWDPDTGAEMRKFDHRGVDAKGLRNMRALAFAPDGRALAACGPRGRVGTETWGWDPRTGEELFRLETGWSECIAFSPDGQTLAASAGTSTGEKVVRLWDVGSRQVRATLAGHQDVVYYLTFSPDGRTLATASWDGTIRLWHVASAQPLVTLRGHRGAAYCVVFSPDGRTLASSSAYRQAPKDVQVADLLLWHAATPDEVAAQLATATAPPGTVRPPAEPRLPISPPTR